MKIQYHYGLQSLSDSALINPCFDGFTHDCGNSIILMQDMQFFIADAPKVLESCTMPPIFSLQ